MLHATVCRVCESACGLLATVEDGEVTELRPDARHPVSRGFACGKGLGFVRVHAHPRRILRPRVREGEAWRDVSWDDALAQVGGRLSAILGEHGPDAVGLYLGNAGQAFGTILGAAALQRALGTRKLYSALTLDNAGMFPVLEACVGSPLRSFVADYDRSDLVVLFGTDPLSSQPSQAQANPDGVRQLLRVAGRGQLVVVDPRPSTTARKGQHLAVRPGGDVAVLAWLAGRAAARLRGGNKPVPALVDGGELAALEGAFAPWTRERAAAETGLGADALDALDARLAKADRPLVWSGLGVLLGPAGTVGYWLTLVLQALLGGIDVAGGWVCQPGPVDLAPLLRRVGPPGWDPGNRSRIGGFPAVMGTHASATLADDVLREGKDRLRALVVVGGNPAVSLPDTPRALEALRALDLLVVLDVLPSDTASLAHVVLPAADWLERAESGLAHLHTRPVPHAQWVPRVVRPRGEAREDGEILGQIARAAGRPRFGSWVAEAALRVGLAPETIVEVGASWWMAKQWRHPGGWTAEGGGPGTLSGKGTARPDGKLALVVPAFVDALAALAAAPVGGAPPDALRLVTSVRPMETHNSWLHDGPGRKRVPRAHLSPAEAARRGLVAGERVRVERVVAVRAAAEVGDGRGASRSGAGDAAAPILPAGASPPAAGLGPPPFVEIALVVDEGLADGVLVLPFGWGHLPGGVADEPGVNANVLVGVEALDPFTGAPVSNGAWVRVTRAG